MYEHWHVQLRVVVQSLTSST